MPIEKLRAFTEVYGLMRQSNVEAVDHDVLIRNAIEGLLKVDPLAAYIDPDEFRELQAGPRAGIAGVGLEMTSRAGALLLVRRSRARRHRAPDCSRKTCCSRSTRSTSGR